MSKELNDTLKKAYNRYKDDPTNSPVPLGTIKDYLKLEGIEV